MKIEVIKSKSKDAWYEHLIGERYEVIGRNVMDGGFYYHVKVNGSDGYFVEYDDAKIIEEDK